MDLRIILVSFDREVLKETKVSVIPEVRMSKVVGRILSMFVFLGLVGSVLAADAWMTKDFKQWDAKDVSKIMNDSPWAKTATVSKYWPDVPKPGSSSEVQGPASNDFAQATFLVRWVSSVTMHRAIARNGMLTQNESADEADKYANQIPATYDVAIIGHDMYPFGPLATDAAIEQLRQKVYIESKGTNLHVTPIKVEPRFDADGKTIAAVTFHFPKKNADGSPVFAPSLKGVDFVCSAGKDEIKVHFDFTKMVAQQGLDL
jgi:hypothetical protein